MTVETARPCAVILGAGIGGLSAAVRLASAGWRVTMLEQNPTVGGKMNQIERDGFRWDTGPSVITMRPVFEELFAAAGRRLEDYLTLLPVEPLTRYFYPDGVRIDATRNLSRMAEQLARLDERDVEGYLDFLAYAARLHRITGPVFIYHHPPTWRSFLRVSPVDMARVDAWLTMDQAIRRRVRSPHLRQLLARFATYVGADPYQAPATLSVIAHVELTGGVWYPRGGVYRIAAALVRLATELGIEIHTSTPVERIEVRNGRAVAAVTADGSRFPADAVIANIDVTTVYEHLLPRTVGLERRLDLKEREPSCSGYVLLLGVEGTHPQLAHHNIFFNRDYRREFVDIFRRGVPPQEPTVYVAITSKSDPDHAPPGCENWFVLVNAPALGPAFDWERNASAYRTLVLETLAHYGLDVRRRIRVEHTLTPVDIRRLTGAWRGALYGISSNQAFNAFRRPHNRCPDVQGLYFVGGTTHPGGGVPMVALSGKIVAEMIRADFRS
ncbi:NAD(P)/FAD-dependent oxidoreductase [Caldilinea sp.]|uniref:phytoene desaturase family protein n=1 Tax=Caldilinea sp. TaxID=2293560 RepID=UPI0021DC1E19|nr:phytoene desaturase family protein [Caldilinea sp.]GIV71449.1 MAG: phytoene desaturase [Caldilinea sp.]